jgi:hypothetical protein
MSGLLYAAVRSVKESMVTVEGGWVPEPVWTWWRRGNPCRGWNPGRPAYDESQY